MNNKCIKCNKSLTTAVGYGFQTGYCCKCYYETFKVSYSDNTEVGNTNEKGKP